MQFSRQSTVCLGYLRQYDYALSEAINSKTFHNPVVKEPRVRDKENCPKSTYVLRLFLLFDLQWGYGSQKSLSKEQDVIRTLPWFFHQALQTPSESVVDSYTNQALNSRPTSGGFPTLTYKGPVTELGPAYFKRDLCFPLQQNHISFYKQALMTVETIW